MMHPVFCFDELTLSDDANTLSCRCVVTADMPFFHGHFPGKPLMPAAAQLEMIQALLQQHAGWRADITGGDGLKFSGQIAPGDCLAIHVQRKTDNRIHFTVENGATLVTKGNLRLTGGALG